MFDADVFVALKYLKFFSYLPSKCALIIKRLNCFQLTKWTVVRKYFRHAAEQKLHIIYSWNCSRAAFFDKCDKIARLSQWINSKSFLFHTFFANLSMPRAAYKEQKESARKRYFLAHTELWIRKIKRHDNDYKVQKEVPWFYTNHATNSQKKHASI